MKPWQLNRRMDNLSQELAGPVKTQTRIDYNCLSEPERQLLNKVQEIVDKYAPAEPPQDVMVENAHLCAKGLEIFFTRVTELFSEVIPMTLCCDELEEWYFKLYFYNFWLDWMESVEQLRKMPKEQHQALLLERKEMGLLPDKVFRFHRKPTEPSKENKTTEGHEP
jgi:hypothetical protein